MITRTHDKTLITDTVMTMFDDVVDDGVNRECFDLDVDSHCWLE